MGGAFSPGRRNADVLCMGNAGVVAQCLERNIELLAQALERFKFRLGRTIVYHSHAGYLAAKAFQLLAQCRKVRLVGDSDGNDHLTDVTGSVNGTLVAVTVMNSACFTDQACCSAGAR